MSFADVREGSSQNRSPIRRRAFFQDDENGDDDNDVDAIHSNKNYSGVVVESNNRTAADSFLTLYPPDPTEILQNPINPIPLSREEAANAEIRALAEKLAPTLVEADRTLWESLPDMRSTTGRGTTAMTTSSDDDIDDGIDQEMRDLQISEELLRQELALAQDFDNFLKFTAETWGEDSGGQQPWYGEQPPRSHPEIIALTGTQHPPVTKHEADLDPDPTTPVEDGRSPPRPVVDTSFHSDVRFRDPSTPSSTKDFLDLSFERTPSVSLSGFWMSSASSSPGSRYHYQDHMTELKLRREHHGCWYSVDLTSHLVDSCAPQAIPLIQEYCLAIPETKLKQVFVGLADRDDSPLPVRTLTIRIRPDVLCGAVMEAVSCALAALQGEIVKRQGGHLLALLPEYKAEFQLATEKSESQECARKLIVRIFYLDNCRQQADDVEEEAKGEDECYIPAGSVLDGEISLCNSVRQDNPHPGLHLRECAALIQRIEAPTQARKLVRLPPGLGEIQSSVSEHLLKHYKACPSVRQGGITLPSLNANDFDVIQQSWKLIDTLWEELETRDQTYNTLEKSCFGKFPALPTLDVHYCSQLRRISREQMIGQLLKMAKDLEDYAREAEYACANMISLLQPTFHLYDVEEPRLPEPVPLSKYELDFVAPQVSCPPWGQDVQHAMNEIQAWSDTPKSDEGPADTSFRLTKEAVQLVLRAFAKQDDEEKAARLQRKNAQVMDRLDKMLCHEKKMVEQLSRATSEKALKAIDEFWANTGIREMPLLRWKILSSGAGTMTVTCRHILFSTQMIPVLGEKTLHVYPLNEIDIVVKDATPSLINPFSTVMVVKDLHGEEKYTFRLSSGGMRLKGLLERLKENHMIIDVLC